jgi:hypothetical protein
MELFPRGLRGNLRPSLDSRELNRDDKRDERGGKLTEIFQWDSLDLVELTNDDRRKRPKTKDGR